MINLKIRILSKIHKTVLVFEESLEDSLATSFVFGATSKSSNFIQLFTLII